MGPLVTTEWLAGELHKPDLVVHGHSHRGTFEGCIGPVPVYNVAVHVIGRDFWVFALEPARERAERPVAVEVESPG